MNYKRTILVLASAVVSALADTCGPVSSPLNINGINVGYIDSCICTSNLASFISTNPVARQGVNLGGLPMVTAILTQYINSASQAVGRCIYPTNGVGLNSPGICTSTIPCAFSCLNGFMATSNACVCPAPSTVCNSVCGSYPNGCSTSGLGRRESARPPRCFRGQRACRVPGRSLGSWECIDIQSDLESCGGCSYGGSGTDCTSLAGVADVACVQGECVINKCSPGFSANNSRCIEDGDLLAPHVLIDQYGMAL
ncbi:unnamed protein product [Mycena citricolor]|uniref:Protein CPL1-like domain-containing protein n=1 Tax=Mycena citricolor TaxID=2018698 RepID=A0AAD2JU32_9AGAR|nr:unnamed protein product [Mycena citricolor]